MYRVTERMQKRKDEKRQLILDTAAKVISEKGYHDTSVKDIVKAAGTSVGCFYYYFSSKENLFLELFRSIVKQFDDTILSVLDIEKNTMVKNYTRVMTATLWMYEQKRAIARIILLEAVTANPHFQKIESDRMTESARTMAEWFNRFRLHNDVNIPNENIAAFMYTGTYYCLINNWLASDTEASITKYCYEFCVYNLQALKISFDADTIKAYIEEVLNELSLHGVNKEVKSDEEGEADG